MIAELDKLKVPEKEIVRIVMEAYGVDEVTANFIIGQERGEIKGDVIELKPGESEPEDEVPGKV